MRQAIHIFKKDVRQLRYTIAAVLGLTILFAVYDAPLWSVEVLTRVSGGKSTPKVEPAVTTPEPAPTAEPEAVASFSIRTSPGYPAGTSFTLTAELGWLFLIARAIHTDALVGDRQFWVTRPYRRRSLWAAKAMLVLVVVNAPILIAQAAIVKIAGFSLAANLPGLLWEQVLLTATLLLPAAAISAVTGSMAQFILCALLVNATSTAVMNKTWGGLERLPTYAVDAAVLAISIAILVLQFSWRKTWTSRKLGAAGAVAAMAVSSLGPWNPLFAMQFSSPEKSLVQTELLKLPPYGKTVSPVLLLRVTGLPGDLILCEAATVAIASPSNGSWSSGLLQSNRDPRSSPNGCNLSVNVDPEFFENIVDRPVRIRTTFYVTTFGRPRSIAIPANSQPVHIPGVGECVAAASGPVSCKAALRRPRGWLRAPGSVDVADPSWGSLSYSPFPAELMIGPVAWYWAEDAPAATANGVTVAVQEPAGHFRSDAEFRDVRIRDLAEGARY